METTAAADPAAIVADHGGHVIRRRGCPLLGVWGLQKYTLDHPSKIIETARALCNEGLVQCLGHAQNVRVPKANVMAQADDAVIGGLAERCTSAAGATKRDRHLRVVQEDVRPRQ